MARRRRGRPISGILVLDKPAGLSSNRALQRAKGLYRAAKAGHTGSLDPLATGVLPLCFGEATKVSQYLLEADKIYESTFVLGVSTDTGDAEGTETARADARALDAAAVEAALVPFRGEIEQVPSMYSAIKQGGRPLYELARQGLEVERKARRVTVHAFELQAFRPGEQAEAEDDDEGGDHAWQDSSLRSRRSVALGAGWARIPRFCHGPGEFGRSGSARGARRGGQTL